MSDKIFELSLTALSILVAVGIILTSIFIFSAVWAIIIGLVILVLGGGALLYYWGKSYMSRL
jgi:hypothetical protein